MTSCSGDAIHMIVSTFINYVGDRAKDIWMGTGASLTDREENVIAKYIFNARLILIKVSILRLKTKTQQRKCCC